MRLTFPVHRVPRRALGPSQCRSLEPGGTNHFTACAQESYFPPGEPGQQGLCPPKAGREQTLEGPLSSGTPQPQPQPQEPLCIQRQGGHTLAQGKALGFPPSDRQLGLCAEPAPCFWRRVWSLSTGVPGPSEGLLSV